MHGNTRHRRTCSSSRRTTRPRRVDLKFLDFLGIWQHFTIPTSELSEELFEEGIGFDGSSIRGWQPINASDMLVMPDPATAVIDPVHGAARR